MCVPTANVGTTPPAHFMDEGQVIVEAAVSVNNKLRFDTPLGLVNVNVVLAPIDRSCLILVFQLIIVPEVLAINDT
jgi:hypothetical protein